MAFEHLNVCDTCNRRIEILILFNSSKYIIKLVATVVDNVVLDFSPLMASLTGVVIEKTGKGRAWGHGQKGRSPVIKMKILWT